MSELCSVAIYETNRSWGGPHEGGWWYDTGEPTKRPDLAVLTRVFNDEDDARAYLESIRETALQANREEGRREPSSVLCNGWYAAELHDGYPKPYPETKPHYE